MAIPTTAQLLSELETRVQTVDDFGDRNFSIYNMDEIQQLLQEGAGFPAVFVGYEATSPREGNQGISASGRSQELPCDVIKANKQFTIVVAVDYNWDGEGVPDDNDENDTKRVATDLLDSLQGKILGFQGVNSAPWRFIGEGPTDNAVDGVIFYAQVWETTVTLKGENA